MNAAFARCGAVLAFAAAACAQTPVPRIGYVYPAGGRQGSTFEVTAGGQFLDGVNAAFISGTGVTARVLEHVKPTPPAQIAKLRNELQELMEQRKTAGPGGWTAADGVRAAELRAKLATAVRRPATPALGEMVRLAVTIDAGVAPGERDLRLSTRGGLTNPLVFRVGELPEVSKKPAGVLVDTRIAARAVAAAPRPPEPPIEVSLPIVVNGQMLPGAADRYRFRAARGQRLVVAVAARQLIPYISDAVPGWFQAVLALYDPAGKEVRYADDYRFHPDPVLYYEIADDGEHTLEIRDSIYRGREDFVYRVALGEFPFITGIFPLGGKAGARTPLEVRGWNLPAAKLNAAPKASGVERVSMRGGHWTSNAVPFSADALPERREREPNDDPKKAEDVKLPVIVNGRIDDPGNADVFRFKGRRGEEIVAEVQARRLDSPLDSVLRLTNAAGREIAINDDYEDRGAGLNTHHADSRIQVRLPGNGTFYVYLRDAQNKGGAEYAYRLRLSRPRPDFDLRVTPASVTVRAGAAVPITVFAMRKDGFAGDISLDLEDAPSGFVLSGATIPGNQDQVRLTLAAPPAALGTVVPLSIAGRAVIGSRKVRHRGVPADDRMQAFAYHHLVPAREWLAQVIPGARRVQWNVPADPVKLTPGKTSPVRIEARLGRFADRVQYILNEPPEGIAIEGTAADRAGVILTLRTESGKVKRGLRGNLIVQAVTTVQAKSADGRAAERRVPIAFLPAIPFEVVER